MTNLPAGISTLFLPEYTNRHQNFTIPYRPNTCFNLSQPFKDFKDPRNYQATTKNFQWLIQYAIDNKISMRALGAGWSFTQVAMSDGIVDTLELRNFFKIEDSFLDPAWLAKGNLSSNLVFSECGLDIQQLHKELEQENGWMQSLRASGASNGQTVAGATSTGTHGAAYRVGAVHDMVIGMHIITGPGKHVWLQKSSNPVAGPAFIQWLGAELISDDDIFNAAVVSFGSFGFIHGLLIETEPIFLLEKRVASNIPYNDSLKLAINQLDFSGITPILAYPENGPNAELYHFEVLVNPHKFAVDDASKGVFVKTIYKIPYREDYAKPITSTEKFQYGDELLGVLQTVLDLLGKKISEKLVPGLVSKLLPQAYPVNEVTTGTMGEIFSNTFIRGQAASAAIAISVSNSSKVIEEIVALNKTIAFAGAIALRFVKGTNALLGFTKFPHTCVLEMDGVDSKSSRLFFQTLWERLEELNIPYTLHWGKVNFNLTAERVRNMYGEATVDKWIACRHWLLDEACRKVFTNNFMRQCGLDG